MLPVRVGGAGQCAGVAWADVRLYICLPAPEDGGLSPHLLLRMGASRSIHPMPGSRPPPDQHSHTWREGWGEGRSRHLPRVPPGALQSGLG